MGGALVYRKEPLKDVEHEDGSDEMLMYATGSMQGWRLNMVSIKNVFRSNFWLIKHFHSFSRRMQISQIPQKIVRFLPFLMGMVAPK